MKKHGIIFSFLILFFLSGCGTLGEIKEYHLNYSNKEIVSIVDQFLIANPNYFDDVDDGGWGFVDINIPVTKEKFEFRIGGDSLIVLLGVKKENEPYKLNSNLNFFEKKDIIKSFEDNFLTKLKGISPQKINIINDPFILSSNLDVDTVMWRERIIKHDTLISFALPKEFKTTSNMYFQYFIKAYSEKYEKNLDVYQIGNLFRINKDYSGYIADSLYITSYYRKIGEIKTFNPVFKQSSWLEYISNKNAKTRMKKIEEIISDKIKAHDIVTDTMAELWMKNVYNPKKQKIEFSYN